MLQEASCIIDYTQGIKTAHIIINLLYSKA